MAFIISAIQWLFDKILGQESENRQVKRQIITEYYPDLISDFRSNWESLDGYFLQGRMGQTLLQTLEDLEHTRKIKRIQSIDEELYNNLMRVHSEVIPEYGRLDQLRVDARTRVSDAWTNHIDGLRREGVIELRPENVPVFIRELMGKTYWRLTDRDYEKARRFYYEYLTECTLFETYGAKAKIPIELFDNLISLFEEEWIDISSQLKDFIEKYDSLIRVQIINHMSESLKI